MKNVWKNSVEISAERDFRRESIRHGPDTAVEELGPIVRALIGLTIGPLVLGPNRTPPPLPPPDDSLTYLAKLRRRPVRCTAEHPFVYSTGKATVVVAGRVRTVYPVPLCVDSTD